MNPLRNPNGTFKMSTRRRRRVSRRNKTGKRRYKWFKTKSNNKVGG